MALHSQKSAEVADAPLQLPAWLRNLPILLVVLGAVGILVGYISIKDHGMQLGYSYLLAFMFFLSICLGGLFLVILHHLFDAMWSVPIRRVLFQCLLPNVGR